MVSRFSRGNGNGLKWLVDHVDYKFNDCLKWPLCQDGRGYGHVSRNGKILKAHRVMCELAYGPAPTPEHEAAHNCGRGHLACVNPKHIEWKTRSENQRDRRKHGTHSTRLGGPRYKLTPENIAEIRRIGNSETRENVAKRFDVTPGTIIKVITGKHWTTSVMHETTLTDDKVRQIRVALNDNKPRLIAEQFGVSTETVYRIKWRKTYKHVS